MLFKILPIKLVLARKGVAILFKNTFKMSFPLLTFPPQNEQSIVNMAEMIFQKNYLLWCIYVQDVVSGQTWKVFNCWRVSFLKVHRAKSAHSLDETKDLYQTHEHYQLLKTPCQVQSPRKFWDQSQRSL